MDEIERAYEIAKLRTEITVSEITGLCRPNVASKLYSLLDIAEEA